MARWKWVVGTVVGTGVLVAGAGAGFLLWASEPRPEGKVDPESTEKMAQRLEASVNVKAWREQTGAVRWTFAGRRQHLWDRKRGLVQVTWGDRKALLRAGEARGVAFEGAQRLEGEAAQEVLDAGHAAWINDAFWLNPLAKLRDPGVELRRVDLEDGEQALLVRYTSGGLTPGDAYLWLFGSRDRPRAWRMWVSNVPVGGIEVSWEDYETLSTGAVVSTRHEAPPILTLELTDVAAAEDLETLLGEEPDPFKAFLGELE